MFEISDLKAKKLPELQEIAKGLNVPKFKSLKKLDLVYQILDVQASNPKAVAETVTSTTDEKPAPAPKNQGLHAPKPRKQKVQRVTLLKKRLKKESPEAKRTTPNHKENLKKRTTSRRTTSHKTISPTAAPKRIKTLGGATNITSPTTTKRTAILTRT